MRILFLNKRVLFPADTGGRIRTLNVLRHLCRWHDVTYLCSLQPGEEAAVEQMNGLGLRTVWVPWREVPRGSIGFYRDVALNLFSRYPFNVNKDFDPALRAAAARLLAQEAFDLVVCDFVQMGRNLLGLQGPPRILFEHNVEAQIFERHAESDEGFARRALMALQAAKMRRFEGFAGSQFDRVIAVSDADKQEFRRRYGWSHVCTIDTAVDTEYFRPAGGTLREDVVFVGSLDWLPNQDGVAWFINEAWPLIMRERPGARFCVVGRNPTAGITALGRRPGVEIVGTVPDTRPHLAQAALAVVPLRIGGGTRIKIFEAMAMGKAVISTTLGAEGLDVRPEENIILADDRESFARAVLRLLSAPAEAMRLGNAARALVETRFSAEAVARQFEAICLETAAQRGALQEGAPALHVTQAIDA
jgi:glycosyltransferase involved in cell wall biosynthesis